MKRNTMLLPVMFVSVFFCSIVHAYPNKITVINMLPDDALAHATTVQALDVSQTVPHNKTVIFQGNNYTKIKVIGRMEQGQVTQGAAGFSTYADVEDTLTFDKGISGEVTIQFDEGRLTRVK